MPFSRTFLLRALSLTLASGIVLAKPNAAAAASAPATVDDDDAAGALIGELVFHADLLSALDRLCPARGAAAAPAPDWHDALRPLLEEAFTPELRDLSRRLGDDAGSQVVQQRGGCHTRGFAAAYREAQGEYRSLLERWRALD